MSYLMSAPTSRPRRHTTVLVLTVLILSLAPSVARAGVQGEAGSWVQTQQDTGLWSGPDERAVFFGGLRKGQYLQVLGSAGSRLFVLNPRSNNVAWVDRSAVRPNGAPPPDYLAPRELARLDLPARTIGRAALYREPVADDAGLVRTVDLNTPLRVLSRIRYEGQEWLRTSDDEYVAVADVRQPGPPAARFPGRWIDADLTEPVIVTAYAGTQVQYAALAIKGVHEWPTPVGTFRIIRRVANETMSSAGLGIPPSAPGGYLVTNVLFTQYFTESGASLHYNYWSSNFGHAGSHGCLGLNYDDARWFWNWASIGTPIVIHA